MKDEKIIEKIKNLLDLANNNPSENEAIAAALKAQELMAKYDIEIAEVEGREVDEEIVKEYIQFKENTGYCIKWRFQLASIIADNFKVKTFRNNKKTVVFYGFKSDVMIATSVFNYLFEAGNKLSCKYYYQCQRENRPTRGVMNTYLMGFMRGLEDVLAKQCTALMIVVPKKVQDSYDEYSKNFKTFNAGISYSGDPEAYNQGREDGRNAANSRSIEQSA